MRFASLNSTLAALATVTVTAGCGGQVGEEGGLVCIAINTTPLELDDPTPLGFTAGELVDATTGIRFAGVAWASDEQTELTLEIGYQPGTAEFQERDWVGDGGPEAIALDCPDVIQIVAHADVVTADGALDESFEVVALADSPSALTFSRNLEDLSGTFDVGEFAPEGDWTSMRAWLDLVVTDDDATGSIEGQVAGEDGDVAFAQGFPVAVIGSAGDTR